MHDAIVIGAGLFGATIARALRADGRSVLVFDNDQPLAGSKPSGSLMKPSWFSSMGKEIYDPALETLDDLYGLQDLEFRVRPSGIKTTVHWVPTSKVLDMEQLNNGSCEVRNETVLKIENGVVWGDASPDNKAPLIIVAAGIWSNQLLPIPGLIGKQGVSFGWDGQVEENFIRPWAPYKQSVAFNDSDYTMWAGDGTAILPANWTSERQGKSLKRMAGYCGQLEPKVRQTVGIRPYIPKQKPCLLEEREPGLWIATGGAKNGMIAAGWCAHEIVSRTS